MTFLHSLALPENYKIALEGYIAVLDVVRQEIQVVSQKVQKLAVQDCDSLLPMIIPGMGYYSALLTASEIGDIRRFPSAKQLCAQPDLCLQRTFQVTYVSTGT